MDDILEFKRSTREPDKWKCYFVKRSLVTELETLGKLNVADPECIRGFEFLCIEDLNEVLEIPGDDPEKMFFRGKPLSTNVAYPFFANEIQLLCSHPIDISEQELVYSEYGLILSFDLVSFGKFYYRVHDEFRSLTESGQEIAHELLLVLSSVFRQSLDKFGYYQRVIEGDGFLATSPLRQQVGYLKPEEKVANQLDRTLRLVITVMAKVNNAITASEASFSSRCALMLDDYTYGKTGGLHSETGGHTGKALITLSRIQSVLRRWVEERGQEPTSLIYFAVLPDFYERHKEIFDQHRFACVDTYEQQEKESLIQLRILEHQP
ncbi:MAG: hypothetical protein ABFD54_12945 [Armatimonadota bacterium]|nr:hypothetical protein [bacterium]